jgi:beta-lactamase regulating signal transducer with metallopeptidase domain
MGSILYKNLLPALSWTLIHSLWQGLLLTVLAGLVVLGTKRSPAALRYNLLCILFFLFLGGVAYTFFLEWNNVRGQQGSENKTAFHPELLFDLSLLGQWKDKAILFVNMHAHWIMMSWLMIFLFKSGRMIMDLLYIRRLRFNKMPVTESYWTDRIQMLARELGIRRNVSLVTSVLVKVPVVIGHFKPIILVPIGVLSHLPPGEVEAVLLHELAHIRRNDYVVNFIQRLSELIFFFNPGLLWVSSLLRVERENCCDDMAISRTQNKVQFVEALIRCKELAVHRPGYALGFFAKSNLLLQRITRIAYNNNKALSSFEAGFFILNLVALVVLLSGMGNANVPAPATRSVVAVQTKSSPALPASADSELILDQKASELDHKEKQARSVRPSPMRQPVQKVESFVDVRKGEATVVPSESSLDPGPLRIILSNENSYDESDLAMREEMEAQRMQADRDRMQMEKQRAQAALDREQAALDRIQAAKDRQQAQKDWEQARRDRQQVIRDRQGYGLQ